MVITLANLHEATEQQIFDQVSLHMIKQNEKSTNIRDNGVIMSSCRYRSNKGLKCAVGCLMTDSEYREDFENKSVHSVALTNASKGIVSHRKFLACLQFLHDSLITNSEAYIYQAPLHSFAKKHNLNTDVMDKYIQNNPIEVKIVHDDLK